MWKCAGKFSLGWGGIETSPIDINADVDILETEVSKLLGIYESSPKYIEVTKSAFGFGMKWLVTFTGIRRGDIGILSAHDDMLSGDNPIMRVREISPGITNIYPGSFNPEIQSVTIARSFEG